MGVKESFVVWGLCFMVLVVEPDVIYGSSRGPLAGNNGGAAAAPVTNGLCAISVTTHGYKCEEHELKTDDGYILSMQRIPQGRAGGNNKQPVLIQHGIFADGIAWLLNSPEQNLPMILADNGFDVWISNTRGTKFSRKHVSLNPDQPEFWDWSWDDLVKYDIPAFMGYVFNHTGQKMHYIGHSLGTLMAMASFSQGHQADMLQSAAFLSPIAYLSHMKTALGVIAAKSFVGEIVTAFRIAEFNPKGRAVSTFLKALCFLPNVDCYDLLSAVSGKNCCLNSSTIEFALENAPQPTATKNLVHLAQIVRDGVVRKYDHGNPDDNLKHYGVAEPPVYNISNIDRELPLFLSYGGVDALSDVEDVGLLLDLLKLHDVNKLSVQYIKDYAHLDFIMAVNAKDMVYNQVVDFFKNQQ